MDKVNVKHKIIYVALGLTCLFIAVQFLKLATVGRLGSEISRVKNEQNELQIQNEILKAEISKIKTPENIHTQISQFGEYVDYNPIIISANTNNDVALNNDN